MQRYIIKVHGNKHCPDRICHPQDASEWEGGVLEVNKTAPRKVSDNIRSENWIPSHGDELWIWTHEGQKYGAGRGLTARASVGSIGSGEGKLLITLAGVALLETPVTLAELKKRLRYGSVMDRLIRSRHPDIFRLSDEEYEGFCSDIDLSLVTTGSSGGIESKMNELSRDIISRVASANGQTEERAVKNKELFGFSSREALCNFLVQLWEKQEGLCNLTSLPMQWRVEKGSANHRIVSVDRIDSDRHYSPDNLQLTCWFANRWKGTTSNEEFIHLLSLVRNGSSEDAFAPEHGRS